LIRNLAIIALLMISLLAGLIINDYYSIPAKSLVIFYTSNLRGQIKPFSGTVMDRHYEKAGGLAFIKGFIQNSAEVFNYNPAHTLLLDTGDALFGTAEASLTMGEVPLRLMSLAGFDAMAIGNMEFEYGLQQLKSFIMSHHLPMLACNYHDLSSPVGNTFQPGKIIEKGGIKVGIIGLGHGDLARNTRPENIIDIEISDLKASVQETAAKLKAKGAEILILLSHHPELNSFKDPGTLFPDIDIIIGDLIGPGNAYAARPLICQTAPNRGGGLGMVKVSFVGGKWDLARSVKRIFPINAHQIKPDQELAAEISRVEAKIDTLLEEQITTSNGRFNRSYSEESEVGNLIADCMKEVGQTQVALQNSGGIKSEIHKGPVTLRTLYNILPFENNLVTLSLKGWELENLIEESLAGNAGFLQSSGINCIYSSSNPPGFRIIQIDINNVPLEFNKTYTITVNDFMAENDKDWPELYHAEDKKVLGLMRESFEDYLRNQASITPRLEQRFKDFEKLDETLRIQALSFELATLPESIKHNGEITSEYSRLLAEVCRLETQSDFALIPVSLVLPTREKLKIVTPARVISDFATKEGISSIELPGKTLKKIVDASLNSATTPLAFSGFSVEKLEGGKNKIIAWDSNFNPDNIYKVALNENFPLYSEGYYDLRAYNRIKHSNDIRRSFINGLRRRNGQVKIKRAIY
jgi:2',3'-cyclic-nucleotide 2'-phosphodiesterase (5'-nucleotidase family)